jgi:hypothetical protein
MTRSGPDHLNPPSPLFLGEKERNLVKQVNDELLERVIGQQILYLPVSVEFTNFHPLYGEAIDKSFLPPVRVYALVEFDPITTTTENYGLDKNNHITVKFHERRLHEDQDLYIREGDYVQYGNHFYEIVTLTEGRQLFGQIDHLFQIEAHCIRTRKGLLDLEVMTESTRSSAISNAEISSAGSGDTDSGDSAAEEVAPAHTAAKVVHMAEDPSSGIPGVLGSEIAADGVINDLFGITPGSELDFTTFMIFRDGVLQLVSDVKTEGDFYLNEENEIITNMVLPPGTILTIIFLTAIISTT